LGDVQYTLLEVGEGLGFQPGGTSPGASLWTCTSATRTVVLRIQKRAYQTELQGVLLGDRHWGV
jgi:hypothetical protein